MWCWNGKHSQQAVILLSLDSVICLPDTANVLLKCMKYPAIRGSLVPSWFINIRK